MGSAPEDDDFRAALAGVEPLAEPRRVVVPRPRPRPYPRQTRRDERAALAESLSAPVSLDDAMDSGEELVFVREGLGRDVLRKLRRGHWVVQGELDLHGMNREHALFHTDLFLKQSVKRNARCVRIVHGKGLGSRNREPVLKGLLRKWLQQRSDVLAFSQAPAAQGGSGAVLVLLRG
jgi:DNA-nicking Smr family endonuclease